MSDIDKKIAELEALYAEATPGKWITNSIMGPICTEAGQHIANTHVCISKNDASLIVAMHNSLPDLIAEIENKEAIILKMYATSRQLLARAENAEADREVLARKLRTWLAEIEECSTEQETTKHGEEI